MSDLLWIEERRRKDQIERGRRARLAREFGKPCAACGNKGVVSNGIGGQKPCLKCKHRRTNRNGQQREKAY